VEGRAPTLRERQLGKSGLAQRPWIVPIPGTTTQHRLDENIRAAESQLTADDLREIDRAAAQIAVHGARSPEHLQ
jgi:diketogulonate reductase-like aldo/keto reductase